jgi:hypothetical protein
LTREGNDVALLARLWPDLSISLEGCLEVPARLIRGERLGEQPGKNVIFAELGGGQNFVEFASKDGLRPE